MSSIGLGSPLRPKFRTAKKFLSLQMSQTSQALSSELNSMIKTQAMARKRRRVVSEIFATEQTYQEHLHLITSVFLAPLQVACLIPKNAESVIFSNVEAIQAVNRELLSHMETQSLGDAFLALAPYLKLYSTYANNFEQACAMLQDWEKKSQEFLYFKQQQESKPECKGLTLRALLITPVQRVPRYKLLLESLLNKTPVDHPDYQKLQEAAEEISNVASHINENIRQRENFQKMLSIQNSLTGEGAPKILAPGRMFIKEGPLLKVCSRGSQERMFFLFSDMLIYAKRNNSIDKEQCSYTCRKVLPLIHCDLEQVFGNTKATDAGALFKVTCKDKSLLLYSRSQVEAVSWVSAIAQATSKLKTSRASLKRVERGESALGERSAPVRKSLLTRNKRKKHQKSQAHVRKDSNFVSCSGSPRVCLKDSLYPLRKELLAKETAAQMRASTPGTHTYIPGKGKCIVVGEHAGASKDDNPASENKQSLRAQCTTLPSDPNGSQDSSVSDSQASQDSSVSDSQASQDSSVIDSQASQDSSVGDPQGSPCSSSASGSDLSTPSGSLVNGNSNTSEENCEEASTVKNTGVTSRARKKKVAFAENQAMMMSPTGGPVNKCFRLNLSCIQANQSPLREVGQKMSQKKNIPAKMTRKGMKHKTRRF